MAQDHAQGDASQDALGLLSPRLMPRMQFPIFCLFLEQIIQQEHPPVSGFQLLSFSASQPLSFSASHLISVFSQSQLFSGFLTRERRKPSTIGL